MSETTTQVFRFTCPNCQKVLKAPAEWAGRRGVCPFCQRTVTFPKVQDLPRSRTADQLLKLISPDEDMLPDEQEADKIAMLLSQGTCRDYLLASKLIGTQAFSARAWRRILNSAAGREAMRFKIEEQLEKLAEIPDDDEDPAALVVASEQTNPNAWKIMVRYLYYLRHGTCDRCKDDMTGLRCMYLTWDDFCKTRLIQRDRAANWEKICKHHLGL